LHEARLAQTGLPHYEKDLAHSLLSLLPPIFQQTEFGIAARQRRERERRGRFELASTTGDGLRSLFSDAFLRI
jgi:hypothetical protein